MYVHLSVFLFAFFLFPGVAVSGRKPDIRKGENGSWLGSDTECVHNASPLFGDPSERARIHFCSYF